MKVKILNVDNEHAKHRIGQERYIDFIANRMVMEYTDGTGRQATTSLINSLIVQTKNTIYEMQVID